MEELLRLEKAAAAAEKGTLDLLAELEQIAEAEAAASAQLIAALDAIQAALDQISSGGAIR